MKVILNIGTSDSKQEQQIQNKLNELAKNISDTDTLSSFISVSVQLNQNVQRNSSNSNSSADIYKNIISAVQSTSASRLYES